jgi:hypothetical protein
VAGTGKVRRAGAARGGGGMVEWRQLGSPRAVAVGAQWSLEWRCAGVGAGFFLSEKGCWPAGRRGGESGGEGGGRITGREETTKSGEAQGVRSVSGECEWRAEAAGG